MAEVGLLRMKREPEMFFRRPACSTDTVTRAKLSAAERNLPRKLVAVSRGIHVFARRERCSEGVFFVELLLYVVEGGRVGDRLKRIG